MFRSSLLMSVACLTLISADRATAQTQDEARNTDEADVIYVTGRKRVEALTDVPVSATVMSSEALENLNIFDSVDLIRNIPNASIAYGGGPEYLNVVIIRGAGAGRGGGSEPATGLYRNGTYIGSGTYGGSQFSRMDLFDVERAEAFRGPQGALFGRNAVGGAINLVTRRPGDSFGGFLNASYNDLERAEVRGAVDLPVNDVLAFRAGGFFMDQSDGYINNITTGEASDKREDYGLRLTTEVTPSANTDWTTLVEYYDQSFPSFSAFSYRAGQDPFERTYDGPSEVSIEALTVSSEFNHDFGAATFSATGLYKDQSALRFDDLDSFLGLSARNWIASQAAETDRYGIELRLASSPDDGVFDWLIGFDHMEFDENIVTTNTTARTTTVPFEETFSSSAIFGSVDFQASDRLTLGAEIRATWDTKTLDQFNSGRSEEQDFDNITPVVSASYELSGNSNAYARIGTAYRAGGFNRSFPAVTTTANAYDVEKTVSYETGIKTRLGNGLNIDLGVFLMETDDVQIVSRTPGQTATYIQNAGDARVYGLEGAMRGRKALNDKGTTFLFDLGFSVSDGEYTSGTAVPFGATAPVNIESNDFPRLRDLTANLTLSLDHPLSSKWSFFSQLNVVHESGGFEDTFNVDMLADFTILDTRVGFRSDRYGIYVTGKNITDKFYIVERSGGGQLYSNRPAVWGMELQARF